MTGYAGSRDYVGTPQCPQRTRHISTYPTQKQISYEWVGVYFSVGYVDMRKVLHGDCWVPAYPETRRTQSYPVNMMISLFFGQNHCNYTYISDFISKLHILSNDFNYLYDAIGSQQFGNLQFSEPKIRKC